MEWISKTRKKKEALGLQELGERLVELKPDQLGKIPLPEEISKAVALARTITKHGALKRQVQYIGSLMRKTDAEPIREAIESAEGGSRKQAELHRSVEHWRDALLAGNEGLLDELVQKFPGADRSHLSSLVQAAREEKAKLPPSPAPSRALFRYLYSLATAPYVDHG